MKFNVFQLSRKGGRKNNEDRMGYCYTRDAALFVLADGMGGHAEGEVAAQLALQTMATQFQQQAQPTIKKPADFLSDSLLAAHHRIVRYAGKKGCLIRRAQPWSLHWCKKGMLFGCIAVIHGCMLCAKAKFCCVRAITAIWSKESFLQSRLKISIAMYSLLAWARPAGRCLMFLCPCACSKKTGSCCAPMVYGAI